MSEDNNDSPPEVPSAPPAAVEPPAAPQADLEADVDSPAADVEAAVGIVDERPDHLRVYDSVQAAFAAQEERFRGHATIPEAFAAYEARRADSSRRLMLWMQGGET